MTPAPPTPTQAKVLLLFSILASTSACERLPEKVVISETREVSVHDPLPAVGAAAPQRLGTDRVLSILPEGWVSLGPDDFAKLKFSFGDSKEGEVSFSILRSDESSDFVTPNINRWRQQMGYPELKPGESFATDPITLFGQEAKKVSFSGTYKPSLQAPGKPNYLLLGAILQIPQFTFFVKMTGPIDLVVREEKNFDEFTSTLQFH